jgi:hypothetical protein
MMITSADKPRLNYDYEQQLWYLITPVVLSKEQIDRTVQYCKAAYLKRIQGEVGEKRKRMQEAVMKLDNQSIKQFLIGSSEKVLYHSDKL